MQTHYIDYMATPSDTPQERLRKLRRSREIGMEAFAAEERARTAHNESNTPQVDISGFLARCTNPPASTEPHSFSPTTTGSSTMIIIPPPPPPYYAIPPLRESWTSPQIPNLAQDPAASANPKRERAPLKGKPLSARNIAQILAYLLDDSDLILSNGYLCKSERTVWLGQGGIGKSRLAVQLAICCVLGLDFLGVPTKGKGLRWLFLQTENGMRRLKADLEHMRQAYSESDWQIVCEHIVFHTLESDEDGIILLNDPDHFARAEELVLRVGADIIVVDPLRDSHGGELNSDQEMTVATRNLTKLAKVGGRTDRGLLVLHHALTGKAGAGKVMGYDRASFGRNSKALHGWTRAQVNIAPGSADNSDVLVIASGKNNNFKEFAPFAIELDPRTMTYHLKPDFDMAAWQSEITGTKKEMRNLGTNEIVGLLKAEGGRIEKKLLITKAAQQYQRGQKHARDLITDMTASGELVRERKEKRQGKPSAVFIELIADTDDEED